MVEIVVKCLNHHRTYLEGRLAYKIQERAFGGLPSALRRKLKQAGKTGEIPNQKRSSDNQLVSGTTMVREYNGIEHKVCAIFLCPPPFFFGILLSRWLSRSSAMCGDSLSDSTEAATIQFSPVLPLTIQGKEC